MRLVVSITENFTEEFDSLRRLCFPGPYPTGSAADRFDSRSSHIAIIDQEANRTVALARICRGPDAFFEEWLGGLARIPTGKHVVDLGRCLVHPDYRGLSLMKLLCLFSLAHAEDLEVSTAVGSTLANDPLVAPLLRSIGFEDYGPIMTEWEPSGVAVVVQPFVLDLLSARTLRRRALEQTLVKLATKQITVTQKSIFSPRTETFAPSSTKSLTLPC